MSKSVDTNIGPLQSLERPGWVMPYNRTLPLTLNVEVKR